MGFFKEFDRTYLLVGLAILGFIGGIFIIFFEPIVMGASSAFEGMDETAFFQRNPAFLLWTLSAIAQVVAASIFLWPVSVIIREMWKDYKIHLMEIIVAVLFLVVMVVLFLYMQGESVLNDTGLFPLKNGNIKLMVLVVCGVVLCGLSIIGMIFTAAAANRIKAGEKDEEIIRKYLRLREYLSVFVMSSGTVIVLSTLASVLLQKGVAGFRPDGAGCFPEEFVYFYGLFNSLLIGIVYVPVYFRVIDCGKGLRDAIAGVPASNVASLTEWKTNTEVLDDALKLKIGLKESVDLVVPVLAPMLVSFLPDWFQ